MCSAPTVWTPWSLFIKFANKSKTFCVKIICTVLQCVITPTRPKYVFSITKKGRPTRLALLCDGLGWPCSQQQQHTSTTEERAKAPCTAAVLFLHAASPPGLHWARTVFAWARALPGPVKAYSFVKVWNFSLCCFWVGWCVLRLFAITPPTCPGHKPLA